jgi:hypothetical protein
MGKFLQKQSDVKFNIVKTGVIKLNTPLVYITKDGAMIKTPVGYITDGYSKPKWTQSLVGGRFEDDVRPAIIHDYLCQFHGYTSTITGKFVPVSFDKTNDIFYEAMIVAGIKKHKALLMRFAVNFNKDRW